MEEKDFDEIFERRLLGAQVQYGVVFGSSNIIFFQSGSGGSCYGHQNKYLSVARKINEGTGYTVIISSFPKRLNICKKKLFEAGLGLLSDICRSQKFSKSNVVYCGFSNGGLMGLYFATKTKEIAKIIAVNCPLDLNIIKVKRHFLSCNKVSLYYGERDGSRKIAKKFLKNIQTIPSVSHHLGEEDILNVIYQEV